jgi:hypothetical protein
MTDDDDVILESLRTRLKAEKLDRPPCASRVEVEVFEKAIGLALPAFYKRLLTEVANGGFGPGFGLVGIPPSGHVDDDLGGNLRDAYLAGRSCQQPEWRTPCGLLPLCNWGCGIFSFIDCLSEVGRVVTDEVFENRIEFTETSPSLAGWLAAWLSGVDLDAAMHRVVGYREILNPFTKQPISFPVRERIGRRLDFEDRTS